MACDRCGREGTQTAYALGGRRTLVCDACGFVGIPADHRGEGPAGGDETWADVLDRFEAGDDGGPPVTVTGEAPRLADRSDPPATIEEIGGVSVDIGVPDPSNDDGDSEDDAGVDTASPAPGKAEEDDQGTDGNDADVESSTAATGTVPGIDPEHAERLAAAGVRTVGDLRSSSPETLAETADVSLERAERWIENARDASGSDAE